MGTRRRAAGQNQEDTMRRSLAAVALTLATAVPIGTVLVGPAGPAAAVTAVTCTKVSGNVNTTVTMSKCTPEPGKSAKFNIPAAAINNSEATDVWTWHKQSGVAVAGSNSALQTTGQNACRKGSVEGFIAVGIDPLGDPTGILSFPTFSESTTLSLCVTAAGAVKLYPGTRVDWTG